MPTIGIIRGFGEGYNATYYIIKLIKALNKRFRSRIRFEEIPCGDYVTYGSSLSAEALSAMRMCDCVFVGDFKSGANPVEFTYGDIAVMMMANTEYTHVSGFDNFSDIDVCFASYFDGGFKIREGEISVNGCSETRVCSAFTAHNIVKDVSRFCENRRRRLAFVTDGDNAYCADMFYHNFESFVMPLSNFRFVKYSPRELCRDILYDASMFDVVFSSPSFSETMLGVFEYLMKDKFAYYKKYNGERAIYVLEAVQSNSDSGDYMPSLYSYIVAFCDMIKNEFNMDKEASQIRRAMEDALKNGAKSESGEEFINEVINSIQKTVTTKYTKAAPVQRYIK